MRPRITSGRRTVRRAYVFAVAIAVGLVVLATATSASAVTVLTLRVTCSAPSTSWSSTLSGFAFGNGTGRASSFGGKVVSGQAVSCAVTAAGGTPTAQATNLAQSPANVFTAGSPGPGQVVYTLISGTASIRLTFNLTVIPPV